MVCVQTIIHIKGFYDKFVRDDDDHLVAKGVGQAELIAAGDPLSLAQRLATASHYNCCCWCCCCLRLQDVDYITTIIVVVFVYITIIIIVITCQSVIMVFLYLASKAPR